MTSTIAPTHINADSYSGRWMTTQPANYSRGNRTAGWLANHYGDGATITIWEYSGHTRDGRQLFVRTRFIVCGGSLYGYDSDGAHKVTHPADRMIGFIAA